LSFGFRVLSTDGRARLGRLQTARGTIETPAFMPVGTLGAVKGVTPEALDLNAVLKDACEIVEPLATAKGLELKIVPPAPGSTVESDATKVRQILVNLLSNAVKFTDTGTVTAEATVVGKEFLLKVTDTGIGIQPENLHRIFDPFWQAEQKATRRATGTGLGLTVTKRLANLLGGDVDVTSTVGEGTTFTVGIPFGVAHLPSDRIAAGPELASTSVRPEAYVEEALRWLSGTDGEVPSAAQAGEDEGVARREAGRVLVADDNADSADSLAHVLLLEGHEVHVARDGEQALEIAARICPDAAVLDIGPEDLRDRSLLEELAAASLSPRCWESSSSRRFGTSSSAP